MPVVQMSRRVTLAKTKETGGRGINGPKTRIVAFQTSLKGSFLIISVIGCVMPFNLQKLMPTLLSRYSFQVNSAYSWVDLVVDCLIVSSQVHGILLTPFVPDPGTPQAGYSPTGVEHLCPVNSLIALA